MTNTMTAHEPLNYLDTILNEEERRCEYGHQWRNFTISRSGRFKSKNKKREIVDGKLFDAVATSTTLTTMTKEPTSSSSRYINKQEKFSAYESTNPSKTKYAAPMTPSGSTNALEKDRGSYKSLYETNL